MIGISVFPGMENSLEENLAYINQAHSLGIKEIFTSLHIPESNSNFTFEAVKILEEASRLKMNIIADISKKYYQQLNLEDYNLNSLRLDFGFSNKEIARLTNNKNFNITLNASTIKEEDLKDILEADGDISKINACHNYYPRKDTGISESLFKEKNRLFKEYGIEVIAFIPSSYQRRGPIYEGLPTLERHRNLAPVVAAQHLIRLGADKVIIGDSQASDEELARLSKINNHLILIPIKIANNLTTTEKDILRQNHTNRKDPGLNIIRSQEARSYKQGEIPPNNIVKRSKYDVTIDNQKYLRYEGDLQILKKPLPKDERVNVVADATEAKLLLETLKPGDKFKFEIKGD